MQFEKCENCVGGMTVSPGWASFYRDKSVGLDVLPPDDEEERYICKDCDGTGYLMGECTRSLIAYIIERAKGEVKSKVEDLELTRQAVGEAIGRAASVPGHERAILDLGERMAALAKSLPGMVADVVADKEKELNRLRLQVDNLRREVGLLVAEMGKAKTGRSKRKKKSA